MLTYLLSLVVFVLVIGLLVLVHEAGHFFTAKFFKVRVEEFGFGIPPRLFSRKKGETIYSINAIPAGGFVKLTGEDEETEDPRSFSSKAAWQRGIIVMAGVVMNFLLTVLIFTTIYTIGGPVSSGKILISAVAPDSPASTAGLKEGDLITALNDTKTTESTDIGALVREQAGQEINLRYERGGQSYTVFITPRVNSPQGQGPLGVSLMPDTAIKSYPVWEAPVVGTNQAIKYTGLMFDWMRATLRNLVVKREAPEGVGGFIRIGYVTHKATIAGWQTVLGLVGLLSLNLAILNALPLPALDGGRFFFVVIEALTTRKIPAKIERFIHSAGFALLLLLIVLVTYNDVIWVWANTSL